ncbi:MAG: hypothetical protein J5X21_14930 [Candidatus Accumulibacter sp.]|nr:hypothetical protein [Candidatus Accumulibacter conexus]
MAPLPVRAEAWRRLARDLDPGRLQAMTSEMGLGEAVVVVGDLFAGKVRGRVVVDVNRQLAGGAGGAGRAIADSHRLRMGLAALAYGLLATHAAVADDLPSCLRRVVEQAPQEVLLAVRPGDEELLARLVYAEARSTGFADDPRVARGIAWGAMNRAR